MHLLIMENGLGADSAIPLPLIVIGHQVGVPEEDIWKNKAWTDAWVQRLGMMQTEEEAIWSTEMEIEAQHFFNPSLSDCERHQMIVF